MSNDSVKVFISYASEDKRKLNRLITHLKPLENKGLISIWVDHDLKGGTPWHAEIQKRLQQSSIILLLISYDYRAKQYINEVEIPFALRMREEGQALVVPVILTGEDWTKDNEDIASLSALPDKGRAIASWNPQDSGFANVAKGIRIIVEKLRLVADNSGKTDLEDNTVITIASDSKQPASDHQSSISKSDEKIAFKNQDKELDDLIQGLTGVAVSGHYRLVIAGPQMGKTWLLAELEKRLEQREDGPWNVRKFDLYGKPPIYCSNTKQLLAKLLGFGLTKKSSKHDCNHIARKINNLDGPCICILDSADLLERNVEKELPSYLAQVIQELANMPNGNGKSGGRGNRLAFVATSRRSHSEWQWIYKDARFRRLKLSQFDLEVIKKTLREVVPNHPDNNWYQRNAESLLRVTEGLPALLAHYISWLRRSNFGEFTFIDTDDTFDQVASPYIRNVLLSEKSLIPDSKPWHSDSKAPAKRKALAEKKSLLEEVILKLSPYRYLTWSHLEHLCNEDEPFAARLDKSQSSIQDLWNALNETHLTEPQPNLWLQIYPPIRRLLFRYYFADAAAQSAAHQAALSFYESDDWWQQKIAGNPQSHLVLELLWHYIARLPHPAPHYKPAVKERDLLKTADRALSRVSDNEIALMSFLNHLIAKLIDDSEMRVSLGEELVNTLREHLERKRIQAKHSSPRRKL